jgi:hypothetical protein
MNISKTLKKFLIAIYISICILLVGSVKTYAVGRGSDWDDAMKIIYENAGYQDIRYTVALSEFALQSYDEANASPGSIYGELADDDLNILEAYMPNVVCVNSGNANAESGFLRIYIGKCY